MKQEGKKLLIKYLCMALPYGIKIQVKDWTTLETELKAGHIQRLQNEDLELKPYLRPISSMTEEEKKGLQLAFNIKASVIGEYGISSNEAWWVKDRKEPIGFKTVPYKSFYDVIDWFNTHHFDILNLIPKGLAIAVIEENNPYNKQEE